MAHEGGGHGGGGKKKPSFIRSCLTSTIALIVAVYVIVLLGSAAITTFFKNRGETTISVSAATTQPAAQPPVALATQAPLVVAPQNGSASTGGAGSGNVQSFVPSNPSIGPVQVTSSSAFYIVEQADLTQNGQYLSFDDSMNIIAAKLLTTVAALRQYNPALNSGKLTAGQVLIVPTDVISGGGGGGNLPPTGEYASPLRLQIVDCRLQIAA